MSHKEGWVNVNGVPTRVQTWGGWIEDPLPDDPLCDSLIICITGNPGVTPYYHSFLSAIYNQLGVPIWIPCHAGHEFPPKPSKWKYPRDPELYNLSGQVAHKLAFIKNYVPANRKLFFIGHSVGAKIVSELLKDEQIVNHTRRCYLLMPTLERIGQTPNGIFLVRILSYFMSIILFFSWVFSLFPHSCRVWLISCWFYISRQHNVDRYCMDATCHLTLPMVLRNVFNLALDEMEKIVEMDTTVLEAHCSKLKVYFARKDGWAPLSYMDSLKQAKPDIDVNILGEQFYHAFVLDNPEEMADLLAVHLALHRY